MAIKPRGMPTASPIMRPVLEEEEDSWLVLAVLVPLVVALDARRGTHRVGAASPSGCVWERRGEVMVMDV